MMPTTDEQRQAGAPQAAAGARIELAAVGDGATREDARRLIIEYLEWIGAQAATNYGLDFDIAAMAESDLADPVKFFPPQGRFYVVRHAGRAIGVGCLKQLTPTIAEIQRMYIQPGARGLGAGRALVDRLIADAREIGYTAIRLESLKVLSAAHTLYRSVGFREIAPYGDNSMADYQPEDKLAAYQSSALFMELRL